MLYFAMLRNIKTPMSNELLDREALIFKALGHPTRLKIVRALAEGEDGLRARLAAGRTFR